MKGVFLDLESLDRGDLSLSPLTDCLPDWQLYPNTQADEVDKRITDADVLITNKVSLTESTLERANGLRLICVAATGTNNVDLEAASRLGISVCNVTGYATASVVQHVYSLILALGTRLVEYHAAVRAGDWSKSEHFCLLDYPIQEIAGKTLGIIGYGELGRAVAAAGKAFGLRVMVAHGSHPNPSRFPLDRLLRQADIISIHCPLTEDTRNLIDHRQFELMKPDAFLINAARGGIVNEDALLHALKTGQIAGAGIDVLSSEPPPPDHPLLSTPLNNLIVTPHIAWASQQSRQRLVDELGKNIRAFLNGDARNQVNEIAN